MGRRGRVGDQRLRVAEVVRDVDDLQSVEQLEARALPDTDSVRASSNVTDGAATDICFFASSCCGCDSRNEYLTEATRESASRNSAMRRAEAVEWSTEPASSQGP